MFKRLMRWLMKSKNQTKKVQILDGHLIIPDDMTEIGRSLFDGDKEITSVTIPGTVKKIGVRAFAECENLTKVILNEGIEEIDSNVFTGCKKLRHVTYPDSVKKYQGWTFYGTFLSAPVLNVSKTILIFCPASVSKKEWTVPDTVKIISRQAFIYNKRLETLHLPEGLEIIEEMAFVECGLREIIIPYSVREIGENAFWYCNRLKKITILNPETKVSIGAFGKCNSIKEIKYGDLTDTDKLFHLKGQPFLFQHLETSANLNHMTDSEFKRLTALCAQGDANAMNDLANWFEEWSYKKGASRFYIRAANYWRYRAYRKGNTEAEKWLKKYFSDYPGKHLNSILSENSNDCANIYTHSVPGKLLNELGFAFFDAEREYEIKQSEGEEIVVVSSLENYEGPDEDGFGAEYYYEWWFLDENMQPIPGIHSINATLDNTQGEYFKATKDRALKILSDTKGNYKF